MTDSGLGSARPALLILALLVFAGVTTEILPVGLLSSIARDLSVKASTAGVLVGLYAGLVAALAVPLTIVTRRVPRKRLLVVATGSFAVSNVIAALAPGFAELALARVLGGATHAIFFSVCIGTAARLVPPARTGRALALASAGIAAGSVLGVPLGTALGTAVGWRGSFAALAVLLAAALVLVLIYLPSVDASEQPTAPPGRRGRLVAVVTSNAFLYAGHNVLYTYVSVLLLLSGAAPSAIGPILLVFGALGLVGTLVAGRFLDRHFRTTALSALLILTAAVAVTGAATPVLALVVVAGAVWNAAFGPAASIYQTAAVRTGAVAPDLAGAWVVATSNVGIAVGAFLGGAALDAGGIRLVAGTAAGLAAVAAAVVVVARKAFPART